MNKIIIAERELDKMDKRRKSMLQCQKNILRAIKDINLEDCEIMVHNYSRGVTICCRNIKELKYIRREVRRVIPTIRLKLSNYVKEYGKVKLGYDDPNDTRVNISASLNPDEVPASILPKTCRLETHIEQGYTSSGRTYTTMVCDKK